MGKFVVEASLPLMKASCTAARRPGRLGGADQRAEDSGRCVLPHRNCRAARCGSDRRRRDDGADRSSMTLAAIRVRIEMPRLD